MQIFINFSGLFHHLAGADRTVIDIPDGATIEKLIEVLAKKYHELPLKDEKTRFLINENVSDTKTILRDGDHLLIYQMLSGG